MRKKEFLTAILCVVLTIVIIGIVMKSGSKQHPDVLHEAEANIADIDSASEYVHVHPQRLYIEREKQLYIIDIEEQIETLELDDLEEELDVAEELVEEDVVEVVGDEAQEGHAERTTTRETDGSASGDGRPNTTPEKSEKDRGNRDPVHNEPNKPKEKDTDGDEEPNPPVVDPPEGDNSDDDVDEDEEAVDEPTDPEVPEDDEPKDPVE